MDLIKDKVGSKKVTAIKEAGLEDFEKTTGYWMVLYSLGCNYQQSDMYKEAIEAFKQVIRIKPDNAIAHCILGITYLKLNDRGSALEQYKILKSLDSEKANELFNLI